MFKGLVKVGLASMLAVGSLSASDIYMMGKGECKSLESYGLKSGVEGYQQFTTQYGCTLLKKDDNIGYFQIQCSELENKIYFLFVNYPNCLKMSKMR